MSLGKVVVRAKDPKHADAARVANAVLEHALRNNIQMRFWYTYASELYAMNRLGIAVRAKCPGLVFNPYGINPWTVIFGGEWVARW